MTAGFPFNAPFNSPFNGNYPDGTGPAAALGLVVGGSLAQGVEIRLNPSGETLVEDVKVGTFVTIQGSRYRFFGVVTDLELTSSDPRLKHSPPDSGDPVMAQVISGTRWPMARCRCCPT